MECHHIVQEADGGDNTLENCMPLCFDCHADVKSYNDNHPKGTKYRDEELRLHRDRWFEKVSNASPSNYSEEHRELDRAVFKRIFQKLPWEGSISFIGGYNFAGFSFESQLLEDLEQFDRGASDPSEEFVDPTLEMIRGTMASEIDRFLAAIYTHTFPLPNSERRSLPQEWEIEQPDKFIQAVEEIHDSAKASVKAYKDLTREGRRRLAIEAASQSRSVKVIDGVEFRCDEITDNRWAAFCPKCHLPASFPHEDYGIWCSGNCGWTGTMTEPEMQRTVEELNGRTRRG